MRCSHRSIGHEQFDTLPRLVTPANEAMAIGRLLVAYQFIRQADIELQRPRIPFHLVLDIQDPQSGDLAFFHAVEVDHGRHVSASIGRLVQRFGVLFKRFPFHVQFAVVGERGELCAGGDVFAQFHRQFGHLQELVVLVARLAVGQRRCDDRQHLQQLPRFDDLFDLFFGQAMQQQRLSLGANGSFDLLLLVFSFQQPLASHGAAGRDIRQSCDFSLDDVQFLQPAEQRTLLLDQVLVRQTQIEQRSARGHRLAANG